MKEETQMIEHEWYLLRDIMNNSAPCSKCKFFDDYKLKCKFPDNNDKRCEQKSGTNHGWNTKEYWGPIPLTLYQKYGIGI